MPRLCERFTTMGCKEALAIEFQRSHLGFDHDQPELFTKCQWFCSQALYLAYVTVCLIYISIWFVLTCALPNQIWFSGPENHVKLFLYLTNWSYAALVATFIFRWVTVMITYPRSRNEPDFTHETMTWHHKAAWFLQVIAFDAACLVTLVYWTAMVPTYKDPVGIVQTHMHITIVYAVVDTLITATPVRVLHVVYPMAAFCLYCVTVIIYLYTGGTNALNHNYIYKCIIDPINCPGTTAAFVPGVLILLLPATHVFLFGLYKLRLYVYRRWQNHFDNETLSLILKENS